MQNGQKFLFHHEDTKLTKGFFRALRGEYIENVKMSSRKKNGGK